MPRVTADIECSDDRICVRFPYSRERNDLIRSVPGRSFVKQNGKHWHVPLDITTCRILRERFGERMDVGPRLTRWARQAIKSQEKFAVMSSEVSGTLERLPKVLPALYEAIHLGPLGKHMTPEERQVALAGEASYQAADVAFLTQSVSPLNGNEQGTGKTIEWIASVWEAGMEEGNHLVICPKTAVEGTWAVELERWQAEAADRVGIFPLVGEREEREETIRQWQECTKPVKWVVINPTMLQLQRDVGRENPFLDPSELSPIILAVSGARKEEKACRCKAKKGPHEHYVYPYPELMDEYWTTVCIDEAHKGSVRNHRSLRAQSMASLKRQKVCLMSGTPMKKLGGSDLWGMLNFLNGKVWSSYWGFVDKFYEIHDNGFGKRVGLLREDREEALAFELAPYMLRRTKKEVAPWLPDKLYVDVPVRMTPRQAKQYRQMMDGTCSFISGKRVDADGTLAALVRLGQFASAHVKVDPDGDIMPVDSPKVDAMIEKMQELGTFEDPSVKHLVFSRSRRMVDFTVAKLRKEGLVVDTIHGGMKRPLRPIIEEFQEGTTQVMVVVTTAGGTSLTLDAADTVHLLDEMWAYDEDVQAEDRAHRVSQIHQVTVYRYRTIGSIDEVVAEVKEEKELSHQTVFNLRHEIAERLRQKALQGAHV